MKNQGKTQKNMGKEGELRENIEKHEKTRDKVRKTGECMATQGKFSPGFEPSHLCDPSEQMRPQGDPIRWNGRLTE